MAKETVQFPFKDGLKEVKIGDPVYYINANRFYGNKYPTFNDLHEQIVSKIGTKYLSIRLPLSETINTSFNIKDGKEDSTYTGGALYSSIESFERLIMQQKVLDKVKMAMRGKIEKLDYEMALRLVELFKLEV